MLAYYLSFIVFRINVIVCLLVLCVAPVNQ